jgi:hypothetical protein
LSFTLGDSIYQYHLSKNAHTQIDLLPRGKNPLSYYTLYNESKHNILALVVRQGQQT